MRVLFIITFMAVYFTTDVQADITLRYDVMRGVKTLQQHQLILKTPLARISSRAPTQHDFLINLKNGDIIQLDKRKKRYFRINAQTINQYVSLYRQNRGFFQGLISQGMSRLDPQQRARAERLMQTLQGKPGAMNKLQLKLTRRSKTILGAPCRVFEMWRGARHPRDICIADYRDLHLPANEVKGIEQMKKLIAQFRQNAPNQKDLLGMIADGLETLKGLPMEVVELSAGGKVNSVTRLSKISLRKTPLTTFQIPPGYQQKGMPSM